MSGKRINNNLKLAPNPEPVKKKTNARRNKNAGHSFELESVKALRTIGFDHVVTSREENPRFDKLGIDLCNKNMHLNGRLIYNFQCKNMATKTKDDGIKYPMILNNMPKDDHPNILLHNQTVRSGDRFMTKGQFAITTMPDMLKILGHLNRLQKGFSLLNDHFDYIPKELQTQLAAELEALGL